MDDKKPDISIRYNQFIEEINYIMNNLEEERVYEKTGWSQDGFLTTNIIKLREQMNHLLNNIQKHELGIEKPKRIFESYKEIEKQNTTK